MHILIVTAHPSSRGYTHRIAAKYKQGSEESGHTVEILDLYKTDLKQDFLKFEDPREMNEPDPVKTQMQEKIRRADELVIIHPLWWFDAPAILKNWFDINFTPGFAYKYTAKTIVMPQKLLRGKSVRVFITADGPGWFYFFIKPFKTSWVMGRLWFCGIRVKTFRVLSRKKFRSPEYLERWLEKVYQLARRTNQ